MAPLREEIRYQKVQENEDPEEVTVYLYRDTSRDVISSRYRETCMRVLSSMLLLIVALGFVLYELEYGSLEPPAAPQRTPSQLEESWNSSPWAPQPRPGEDHHHEDLEMEEKEEHMSHHHGASEEPAPDTHHHGDSEEPAPDTHHHGNSEENAPDTHHHAKGVYHHAVAITDAEVCSEAALRVLQMEGSVVDAGAAAVFCLSVVHPHSVSLGGVFSSVYYNGTAGTSSMLNAVPLGAYRIKYGVPLLPQGLSLLHGRYGEMAWSELLAPAIRLANGGFTVDSALASALESTRETILTSAELSRLFSYDNGTLKVTGDTVVNPTLGKSLTQIAKAMTNGALPDTLIQSLTGDIEASQKQAFHEAISSEGVRLDSPKMVQLSGMTIITTPNPSAGKILSNLIEEIHNEQSSVDTSVDHSIERAYQVLFNSAKTKYSAGGTSANANPSIQNPLPSWRPAPVEANVLIADAHGDVFAMSLSLNGSFGSGFVSSSTGIVLSNYLQDSEASGPAFWASPAILLLGEDNVLALAASGGSSVPFSLAQTVLNHIYFKNNLTTSVSGPLVGRTVDIQDPWYDYLGVSWDKHETVRGHVEYPLSTVAVEVQSEHVQVASSSGSCCYYKGF